jgi:hypothetical protein
MLSLFAEQTRSGEVTLRGRTGAALPKPVLEPSAAMEDSDSELPATEFPVRATEEFEIVLGRRQVASVLFIATVIVAILSGVSYLAGKSLSPKKPAPAAPTVVFLPAPPPPPPPPVFQISDSTAASAASPTPAAAVAKSPVPNTPAKVPRPAAVPDSFSNVPLFAEPVGGFLYLQMGALGRGAAAIFADGLRKHGFPGFVAPGPSDTLYRVLIGPLPDAAAYNRTKEALDRIGVATFARTFDKQP